MHTFTVLSVCSLAVALTALPSVHAVPKYAKLIPNGNGVTGVNAVGHTDPESGGATNAFGKAFAAAGNAWTEALCKADSDGDGQTNGEELGDPCCAWKSGGAPAVATGAKDPGSATSKLDDAALTASRALCGAAPAAGGAGTVKPAEGATNATPALTPGAPGAAPAAPAAAPGAPAAAPGAAPAAGATPAAASGSGEYDWVPMDQVNKTKSGSSTSAATTPSATSAASSATNATKNATSSAMPSPLSARSSLVQVVAAAVVGVVALAL